MRFLVDGLGPLDARDEARRVVVAQVLADTGQVVLHRDAERFQERRRPDARDLQELRRVHRAAAQDQLAARPHLDRGAVAAALAVAHANGALALEHDLGDVGVRAHGEIFALHRRMQVAAGGALAHAVLDDALHVAHARLHGAVVVAVARDAHLHRALDEGLADRVAPVEVGDRQVAVAAAEGVVGLADPPFAPAEVGQHVGIAPAAVAALGPAVEIEPLAAIVDMAVDRARPAQGLAARGGDGAPAGPFAGLGLVEPVHPRIDQGVHEAGRDMDEGVPVPRPRLEDADRDVLVLAQPGSQYAAGRSRADDDIVESFHAMTTVREVSRFG